MLTPIKQTLQPIHEAVMEPLNNIHDLVYLQWYFRDSKRLRKFKNIHKGESCFIIGNGPSLNKMDLSLLTSLNTFGLNKIYLMLDKVDINLTYHVAVNPIVIEQSKRHFEALNCSSFLSMRPAYRSVKRMNHIYRICTGGSFPFQTDASRILYEGYTVTYVAMQLAFYMGFSKVFLIGVDHNFVAFGKPNEEQNLVGHDPNHFAGNYFGNQKWNLPDLDGSEVAYHLAKFYFERDNRCIYDATVDGKLEIFPKISYEEAIALY